MRADRLLAIALLLRRRGRMTAGALADELEVSQRTILRDIDALGAAGVPVYVDRGRHGGFSLLPGFRPGLAGLTDDEMLALVVPSGRGGRSLGLDSARAAMLRKVVDAIPADRAEEAVVAAGRLLVEPGIDLLADRPVVDEPPGPGIAAVRAAVVDGYRLRFRYDPSAEAPPRWHVVDPIGLVVARGRTYLIASKGGAERTYRVARMSSVERMSEPAVREDRVDLAALWASRAASFLAGDRLTVTVRIAADRRDELVRGVREVLSETPDGDGWRRMDVVVDDPAHAVWALWPLAADAEVVAPASVRQALRERGEAVAARYGPAGTGTPTAPSPAAVSPAAVSPAAVVLVLAGPQAAGKSTLARALDAALRAEGLSTALVELDRIAEMALPTLPSWQVAHALFAEVVGGWARSDLDVVIAEGSSTLEEVDQLRSAAPDGVAMLVAGISADLDDAHARALADPTRDLSRNRDFLESAYDDWARALPALGVDIAVDTSAATVDEATDALRESVARARSIRSSSDA